jgi:hypothetical protein
MTGPGDTRKKTRAGRTAKFRHVRVRPRRGCCGSLVDGISGSPVRVTVAHQPRPQATGLGRSESQVGRMHHVPGLAGHRAAGTVQQTSIGDF